MRTSCLINNFNYGEYVIEAVESALNQTRSFDEIIVVDDGSSDQSRELLRHRYSDHPVVKLIFKENGGQLSCLNAGITASSGDVVFFLDSDDVYAPEYLERALSLYESSNADLIFSAHRKFGASEKVVDAGADRDFGYTQVYTYFLRKWIGAPTSCLSARREVLTSFFPIPFETDWRARADDCIIYGASLVGARKVRLGTPLVHYRRHSRNFTNGRFSPERMLKHGIAVERLFQYVLSVHKVDLSPLAHLAYLEFQTKPRPTFREFRHYTRIFLRTELFGTVRKIRYVLRMAAYMLSARNNEHLRNVGARGDARHDSLASKTTR
ncbi:MAG: glycosyltransferase family 2 protein [Thiohalomonadaceae bacterium]